MSRAFVKEDSEDLAPLPDLPISPLANYVTARGLGALRGQLARRQADLAALRARTERLDRLPEAAAERDIRYLEARLRSAILVDAAATASEVAFGHRVEVTISEADASYEIVGEDEADARLGRIAPHSPLARALIGARIGDVVQWRRPSGVVEIVVVAIGPIDGAA